MQPSPSHQAISPAQSPPARPPSVLLVDDDRAILVTLGGLLERHGYRVSTALTAGAATTLLKEEEAIRLVLLDLGLPDAEGLDTLAAFRRERPELPIIVLTANDSLGNAIESIKRGAFHFISKPYAPEELLQLMERALQHRPSPSRRDAGTGHSIAVTPLEVSRENGAAEEPPAFVGQKMRELETAIRIFAPTPANVLLWGESGVGKEIVASRIHALSRCAAGPMVRLNCAAFPPHMIEGELFGYVRGAFTGAVNEFPGLIAEAHGGTLFLDEIAEMPVELQTRFLRVLQEREYRPLGSTKTLRADFRLISATNRPIELAVRDGWLRRDLYYRLNTFQLEIPPLRNRHDEIPSLVALFVARFSERLGKPAPRLLPGVLRRLIDYTWPGNIRELQNSIEYAVIMAQGGVITERELPKALLYPLELQKPFIAEKTLDLDTRERDAILAALVESHGNKKRAAQLLGIHRPTLYSKMKRYKIEL